MTALAVLAVSLAAVPAALADGDPASDYLITQPIFVPFGNHTSSQKAGELDRLLIDARAKGFPLKVAVIASPYDLGSIPGLFRQPQRYATFLGQEDYYFFKDELLVVMPNGYGLFKAKGLSPDDKRVLAKLPPPGTTNGDELIAAAERAVQALAERRGLTLSPSGSSSSSSANHDRIEIAAGVLVLAAVALLARFLLRRRRRAAA